MATGGVHGFPVVDVRVECYDGKYHSVDSSDMAFRTAAAQGFKEALPKAGSAVLEPVSLLTVTVPEGYQGDVLGDLNSRRGRVSGTSSAGDGEHEIIALVPTAEIQRYAVDLRSMTGGRGTFSAVHDHYDVLPATSSRRSHVGRPTATDASAGRCRQRRAGSNACEDATLDERSSARSRSGDRSGGHAGDGALRPVSARRTVSDRARSYSAPTSTSSASASAMRS